MTQTKVWIYQADRFLDDQELQTVNNALADFTADWKAHGVKLTASYEIKDRLFVIIKVVEDQQNATGCSIDASVHFMKELQSTLGINFFNRQRVAYQENGETKHCSMAEFKKLAIEGAVNADTQVFNNTVTDIDSFEKGWLTSAANSWHKMLLS
jgi:hypothetical protein